MQAFPSERINGIQSYGKEILRKVKNYPERERSWGIPAYAKKRNCVLNITNEERQKLFDAFYAIDSQESQWLYLSGFIEEKLTKTNKGDCETPKQFWPAFSLKKSNGVMVQVCKLMFKRTFAIAIQISSR